MKKTGLLVAIMMMCGCAMSSVPVTWNVNAEDVTMASFNAYHGETIDFKANMFSYGKALNIEDPVCLFYQTNGMGNAWWTIPASSTNNTMKVSFKPNNDPGAKVLNCFLGGTNSSYRASFRLRFAGSPGLNPDMMFPVTYLDFNKVVVTNAPYWTKAESDARYGSGGGGIPPSTVTNIAEYVVSTNLVHYPRFGETTNISDIVSRANASNVVTRAYVEGLGISGLSASAATNIAEYVVSTNGFLRSNFSWIDEFDQSEYHSSLSWDESYGDLLFSSDAYGLSYTTRIGQGYIDVDDGFGLSGFDGSDFYWKDAEGNTEFHMNKTGFFASPQSIIKFPWSNSESADGVIVTNSTGYVSLPDNLATVNDATNIAEYVVSTNDFLKRKNGNAELNLSGNSFSLGGGTITNTFINTLGLKMLGKGSGYEGATTQLKQGRLSFYSDSKIYKDDYFEYLDYYPLGVRRQWNTVVTNEWEEEETVVHMSSIYYPWVTNRVGSANSYFVTNSTGFVSLPNNLATLAMATNIAEYVVSTNGFLPMQGGGTVNGSLIIQNGYFQMEPEEGFARFVTYGSGVSFEDDGGLSSSSRLIPDGTPVVTANTASNTFPIVKLGVPSVTNIAEFVATNHHHFVDITDGVATNIAIASLATREIGDDTYHVIGFNDYYDVFMGVMETPLNFGVLLPSPSTEGEQNWQNNENRILASRTWVTNTIPMTYAATNKIESLNTSVQTIVFPDTTGQELTAVPTIKIPAKVDNGVRDWIVHVLNASGADVNLNGVPFETTTPEGGTAIFYSVLSNTDLTSACKNGKITTFYFTEIATVPSAGVNFVSFSVMRAEQSQAYPAVNQ